jgi:hypothetical protein
VKSIPVWITYISICTATHQHYRNSQWFRASCNNIYSINNQLNVTFSKFFHFIFVTPHISGVPCPTSGVNFLHW